MSRYNSHTSTLFHFTKRQNTLMDILRDGIKSSYCYEEIIDSVSLGIPMTSFCDIPLLSCNEHRTKYGLYAIGFAKTAFQNIPSGCEIGSIGYFSSQQVGLINNLIDMVNNKDKAIAWFKKFNMYRGNRTQINYDECEWRIVPFNDADGNSIQWFWSNEEFSKWKNTRDDKFLDGVIIPFSPSDIRYIIVDQEKNIPNVVKRILSLKTISGIVASQQDKAILCSRVISFEHLKRDF